MRRERDITELLNPADHSAPPSAHQTGGAAIGGRAGGVLYACHALVQVGHQGGEAGGLSDGAGSVSRGG